MKKVIESIWNASPWELLTILFLLIFVVVLGACLMLGVMVKLWRESDRAYKTNLSGLSGFQRDRANLERDWWKVNDDMKCSFQRQRRHFHSEQRAIKAEHKRMHGEGD